MGPSIQTEGIIRWAQKSDQLGYLLTESNLDFLGISETWLKKSSPDGTVNVSGYIVFRKDEGGQRTRGWGVNLCERKDQM